MRGRFTRRRRTQRCADDRVVVGRQHHADARRRAVELLLPARAVVPLAGRGAGALDPFRPHDDRADDSAAADGPGRVRVCVAAGAGGSSGGATRGCAAVDLPLRDAAGDRLAWPRRDRRRRDVEFLVLDPFGWLDVRVERLRPPAPADSVVVPVLRTGGYVCSRVDDGDADRDCAPRSRRRCGWR